MAQRRHNYCEGPETRLCLSRQHVWPDRSQGAGLQQQPADCRSCQPVRDGRSGAALPQTQQTPPPPTALCTRTQGTPSNMGFPRCEAESEQEQKISFGSFSCIICFIKRAHAVVLIIGDPTTLCSQCVVVGVVCWEQPDRAVGYRTAVLPDGHLSSGAQRQQDPNAPWTDHPTKHTRPPWPHQQRHHHVGHRRHDTIEDKLSMWFS